MSAERMKEAPVPLLRPLLPSTDQLEPYLRRIDAARYYTNFGPLVREFEERLAMHFGVSPVHAAVVSNGTTALSAALLAVQAPAGSRCLVPSWTFVASAAAVCAANLTPHFIDVTRDTWMPDPDLLQRREDLDDVGAIMIVAPFGMPFDRHRWDDFTARTGVPVIIDGAACFDSVATVPEARPGKAPIMISLHATKVFGAGEGGLVLSDDEPLMVRLRKVCNFGIWGAPEDQILGYNGKASEYHAAVGLAALDAWAQRRVALSERTARYAGLLKQLPNVGLIPGFGDGWVSAYCTVVLKREAASVEQILAARGIESRRWWQNGVHRLAAYRGFPSDPLPNTEALAAHALSLPFSHDITDDQMDRVVSALADATR